jgi:hypothetical protein
MKNETPDNPLRSYRVQYTMTMIRFQNVFADTREEAEEFVRSAIAAGKPWLRDEHYSEFIAVPILSRELLDQ